MYLFFFSAKNIFRVRFQEACLGQSHTLQANDIFHKQQWLNCIRTAIAPYQNASPTELKELPDLSEECEENHPPALNTNAQRRSSTISDLVEMDLEENANSSVVGSPEDPKPGKFQRALTGSRKTRDKTQQSIKRKETLV